MTLRKVGRFWWLDVRINKKRIRRSLHTTEKRLALHKYGEKLNELQEQYSRDETRFSDFCKQYIEWTWSSKPASALREEQRLRKIRGFFDGLNIVYLNDITPYHIEQLKAELKKTGLIKNPIKARGSSKATTNRYLQILKTLFNRAIDWEIYQKANPIKKIRFYKEDTPIQALSDKDINKILREAKIISETPKSSVQRFIYDMVILALNTGMRKSEILNLRWQDIKEEKIEIKGKGDKRRIVPLNETVKEIISKQSKKNIYIFDIENRHQQDLIRRTINQIKKRTGVDFHFHLLRHAFASRLAKKGFDMDTVKKLMGHSSIVTTQKYFHTNDLDKKKAVDSLVDSERESFD